MTEEDKIIEELSQVRLYRSLGRKEIQRKDLEKMHDLVIRARRCLVDENSLQCEKDAAKVGRAY